MLYRVTCADRETGAEYHIDIEAERPSQATRLAADKGHLASKAEPAPSGDVLTHELLRQMRDEQMQMRLATQRIATSRLVRAPIGTIAVSIIMAMILWGVLCFVLFMSFGAILAALGVAAGSGR